MGCSFHWIAHGRSGTAMRGFLAEEQGPVSLEPADRSRRDRLPGRYLRETVGDLPVRRGGGGNRARLGESLYQGNCASCHGAQGEGATGPQFEQPDSVLDQRIRTVIWRRPSCWGERAPRCSQWCTVARGLVRSRTDQVSDVVAYLRTWDTPRSWNVVHPISETSDAAIAVGSSRLQELLLGVSWS